MIQRHPSGLPLVLFSLFLGAMGCSSEADDGAGERAPNVDSSGTQGTSTQGTGTQETPGTTIPPATTPPATIPPATTPPGTTPPVGSACSEQTTWRPTPGFAPLSDTDALARICVKPENRPLNQAANAYVPDSTELNALYNAVNSGTHNVAAVDNPYVAYVTGACGGAGRSTDDIIQCTAAKWGIPADWFRAQYVQESYWQHIDPATGNTNMGDKAYVGTTAALSYPEFSREKSNGTLTGYVWQSVGLTMVKWRHDNSTHPGTEPLRWKSSAFNADYQASVVRFYYDNPSGLRSSWGDSSYAAGEDWWSLGGWFQPYPWHNSDQSSYVSLVKGRLSAREWEKAKF